ncbi:MAG: (2Fe-2S) ferredoxin domain-containing protein [Sedimentisphaerales bacterium]|nr:(2Fe-2S) ferredoxin domain-containing protein [Sedimentisphaerales bacterium]
MIFRHHVLVCCNTVPDNTPGGGCGNRGSEEVYDELMALIEENGLQDRIKVSKVDCLGLCCMGPIVVVYPDNVWYHKVCPCHAIQEIFHRHLVGGEVAEEFRVPEWVAPGAALPVAEGGREA